MLTSRSAESSKTAPSLDRPSSSIRYRVPAMLHRGNRSAIYASYASPLFTTTANLPQRRIIVIVVSSPAQPCRCSRQLFELPTASVPDAPPGPCSLTSTGQDWLASPRSSGGFQALRSSSLLAALSSPSSPSLFTSYSPPSHPGRPKVGCRPHQPGPGE